MADYVLSVIVPMFNEAPRITAVLDRLKCAGYMQDVIVVDDGSTDESYQAVCGWAEEKQIDGLRVVAHDRNRGKGSAIRTGLSYAKGDLVIIQDADLEYSPEDYPRLLTPLLAGEADVVFGSRYLNARGQVPWTPNRLCVHLLNIIVRVLYGIRLTDEATCYKMFTTRALRAMDLTCERFEFCPEVTAKAARMGLRFREVPITYQARTAREGKKIGWKDGLEAIYTLLRWRVRNFTPAINTHYINDDAPRALESAKKTLPHATSELSCTAR